MPAKPKLIVPDKREGLFFGRKAELEQLYLLLAPYKSGKKKSPKKDKKQSSKNVGIYGPTGIGKTRLANEYAFEFEAQYAGGTYWVNAALEWLDQFAHMAEIVGLQKKRDALTPPRREDLALRFLDFLNQYPDALLILDNVPEKDFRLLSLPVIQNIRLTELRCRLLITADSCDENLPFEWVQLNGLLPAESREFLLLQSKRSQASGREFEAAHQICKTLENHPFSIRQAGMHLSKHPKTTFWGYLQGLTLRGTPDQPDPSDGPHKVLEMQWKTLSDKQQCALKIAALLSDENDNLDRQQLSLFANLSDQPKHSRSSALQQTLSTLYQVSLIEETDEPVLRLHPLVHTFATAELLKSSNQQRLVNSLYAIVKSPNTQADQCRAAELLTRLKWFDEISPTSLPIDEILVYLEAIGNNLETPEDAFHIIEKGLDKLLHPVLPHLEVQQYIRLLIFSGGLQGQYISMVGENTTSSRPITLQSAQQAYQLADNHLTDASRDPIHADHLFRARIEMGKANLLSMRAEQTGDQALLRQAFPLYTNAVREAQAFGQDPLLEAGIWLNMAYAYTLLDEWERSDKEMALDVCRRALDSSGGNLRYYAGALETASHVHEKWGVQVPDPSESLKEFKAAYKLSKESISILQKITADSEDLANAHLNAARYLVHIIEQSGSKKPKLHKKVRNHLRSAVLIAQRLGISALLEETYTMLEQSPY